MFKVSSENRAFVNVAFCTRLHDNANQYSLKIRGETIFELTYKLSVIVYRNVNYGVNGPVIFCAT